MQIDKNPMFRKSPVPWYRSRWFFLIIAILSLCLAVLGIIGIGVARREQVFNSFIWMPLLLAAAAGLLCVFMLFRASKGP